MSIFARSAVFYDALYAAKDYAAEALYVDDLVKRHCAHAATLLDLGCGTGRHAVEFLKRGYRVLGVDVSPDMLARANELKAAEPPARRDRLEFGAADIRQLHLDRRFDAVVALFHVMSYQTSNADLLSALRAARDHLAPGGVFLFDCWYGPGVLSDPPRVRVKRLAHEEKPFLRLAEPVMRLNDNLVEVHYTYMARDYSGPAPEFAETHIVRYFFLPELALALDASGLRLIAHSEWLTGRAPDVATWNLTVVAGAAS
ncbi:MAG: class I SAM-dependent DNA methyltransferase [Stellaceae bacterium]